MARMTARKRERVRWPGQIAIAIAICNMYLIYVSVMCTQCAINELFISI